MNIKNALSLTVIAFLSGCSPHGTDTASRSLSPLVALDEATTCAKIRIELSSSKIHIQTALLQIETVGRRVTDDTPALFNKLALKMRAVAENSFGESIGTGQNFATLIESKQLLIAEAQGKPKTMDGVAVVYNGIIVSLEQKLVSLQAMKVANQHLASETLTLSTSFSEYGDALAFAAENRMRTPGESHIRELEKYKESLRKILANIVALEQSLPAQ